MDEKKTLKDVLFDIAEAIRNKARHNNPLKPVDFSTEFFGIAYENLIDNMVDVNGDGINNIKHITMDSSITTINNNAFGSMKSLESIDFNNVKIIGNDAFRNCSKLVNIVFNDNLQEIGNAAFDYCHMPSIVIPKNVTSIGNNPFSNNSSLVSISVDSNNEYYESKFDSIIKKDNKELVTGCINTIIADDVKILGNYSFYGVRKTSLDIPNGVEKIGTSAFYYCSQLNDITIPDTITSILASAFRQCDNLSKITITSIEHWLSMSFGDYFSCPTNNGKAVLYINDDKIENITIPENIQNISRCKFYNYKALKSVKFSSSITKIEVQAFYGCSNCVLFDFSSYEKSTPPTLSNSNAFSGSHPSEWWIVVLNQELKETWKKATNWSIYSDYIITLAEYEQKSNIL